MAAPLCQCCQGINIERLTDPCGYRHQPTVFDLRLSSATCQGCAIVYQALYSSVTTVFPSDEAYQRRFFVILRYVRDDVKSDLYVEPFEVGQNTWVDPERTLRFTEKGPERALDLYVGVFKSTSELYKSSLALFTRAGDPAARRFGIPERYCLPANTGSDESFERAKGWIRECRGGHGGRTEISRVVSADEERPARLVRLTGTFDEPSLQLTDWPPDHCQYAALSYCWGPPPHPWRTVQSNLSDRHSGFKEDELPLTLREACIACRKLDLEYIWIDALCIVQDDDDDWRREAAKMHLVYSLAHVTLSATSSPSSTHGLFNKASYDHTANFTQFLQIDNMLSDGAPSTLFVPGEMVDDRNGEKGTWHDGYERLWARLATQGPLAKRAWTCQEQILSPQILHFTDAQLFWKCRHHTFSEDGLCILTGFDHTDWRRLLFEPEYRGTLDRHLGAPPSPRLSASQLSLIWTRGLVQAEYSHRSLTYGTDKLLAISSLARVVHAQRPNEYYAGLWQDELPEGLAWVREKAGRPAEEYRAPSWSWASQDSAVEYGTMSAQNALWDCQIKRVAITHRDQNRFGQVTRGELYLDAKVMQGAITGSYVEKRDWGEEGMGTLRLEDGCTGFAVLDDDAVKAQQVSALFLREDFVGFYFLLVTPVEDDAFRRVGMGRIRNLTYGDEQLPDLASAPRRVSVIV